MESSAKKTVLKVTTGLWLLATVPGIGLAMFSVMLFDAPGSEENPATIALFYSLSTFPVICVVSVVLSWILYRRQWSTVACWIACLPLLNVIAGIGAIVYLETFCGGRFSG